MPTIKDIAARAGVSHGADPGESFFIQKNPSGW